MCIGGSSNGRDEFSSLLGQSSLSSLVFFVLTHTCTMNRVQVTYGERLTKEQMHNMKSNIAICEGQNKYLLRHECLGLHS